MTINALDLLPVRTASCSVMGDYALKKKMTVPYGKAKKGDLVLYDFNRNGTSDHTGIIYKVEGGKIYVVEGNTSKSSNDNGGAVMKRVRTKSPVNYIVRPKYTKEVTADMVVATALAEVGTKEKPKNSNNVKYNTWYYGHPVKGDDYPWCMTFVQWCFAHVKEPAKKTTKPAAKKPATTAKKGYTGKFPEPNTNAKIVNGLAYRHCWPYGTPEKKYKYSTGKPTEAYKKGIDKAYPKHKDWPNKKQRVGACCDVFVGEVLGNVGIHVPKDLKNQLVDMPKMTKQLKSNGRHTASAFRAGDVVQRGRKDKSGHTWIVCELVNGKRFVANAHYKKLKGTYAVMDAKPKNIVTSKWKYYKCYTVLGAVRKYYQKGDYGYDVLYIQQFLNWYGIKVTADGDFGAKTDAAVKKFQKAHGIEPTGRVGVKTIKAMKATKK